MKKLKIYLSLLCMTIFFIPMMVKADDKQSYPALTCTYENKSVLQQSTDGSVTVNGVSVSSHSKLNACPKEYNGSTLNHGTTTKGDFLGKLYCGSAPKPGVSPLTFNANLPRISSITYNVLKIVTSLVLIVLGMLDFAKAVIAQKDDEIKKSQQTFIKRLIAGATVFLILTIVQFAVETLASTTEEEKSNISSCLNCFLNNQMSDGNQQGCKTYNN